MLPTETSRPTANLTIPTAVPPTASPTIPDQVEELLRQMTLEEKIGQMTQVVWWSIQPGDITRHGFGSVFAHLFETDWTPKISGYQQEALATRLGIPILYGVDAIHGNAFLLGATVFPQEVSLGATRDAALVRKIGSVTAEEVRATGAVWDFAPIIAVPQDIRWGRTYEAYGEHSLQRTASAFIEGMQSFPIGYAAPAQYLFVPLHQSIFWVAQPLAVRTYVNNGRQFHQSIGQRGSTRVAVRSCFTSHRAAVTARSADDLPPAA
jgi:hypothetical protein